MKPTILFVVILILCSVVHAENIGVITLDGSNNVYSSEGVFFYSNYSQRNVITTNNNSQYCVYKNGVPHLCGPIEMSLGLDYENNYVDLLGRNATRFRPNLAFVDGPHGKALNVSNVGNGFYSYGNLTSIMNRSEGTIVYDFRLTTNTIKELQFRYLLSNNNVNSSFVDLEVRYQTDKLMVEQKNAAWGSDKNVFSDNITTFDNFSWHRVVITWKANESKDIGSKWCVYVDGLLHDCDWNDYNASMKESNKTLLDLFGNWNPSTGQYDNFGIFKKAWSQKQAYDYMNWNISLRAGMQYLSVSDYTLGDDLTFSFKYCYYNNTCAAWQNSTVYTVGAYSSLQSLDYTNAAKISTTYLGGTLENRVQNVTYNTSAVRTTLQEMNNDMCIVWVGWGDYVHNGMGLIVTPLRDSGAYDWYGYDRVLNNSLALCDNTMVKIHCTPSALINGLSNNCYDSVPPNNLTKGALYAQQIVNHTCAVWGNNTCEDVLFQIGNEPHESAWTGNDTFINYYLLASQMIKQYNPSLIVGAASFTPYGTDNTNYNYTTHFLDVVNTNNSMCANDCLNFFSVNMYANNYLYYFSNWSEPFNRPVKEDGILDDWFLSAKLSPAFMNNMSTTVAQHYKTIPVYNTEYNIHASLDLNLPQGPNSTSPFILEAAQSSILSSFITYSLLNNNEAALLFFTIDGTTTAPTDYDNPYMSYQVDDLNNQNITKYPIYYSLKGFNTYYNYGTSLYDCSSSYENIQCAGSVRPNFKTVVLINKANGTNQFNLSISSLGSYNSTFINMYNTSDVYTITDGRLQGMLSGLEVKFLISQANDISPVAQTNNLSLNAYGTYVKFIGIIGIIAFLVVIAYSISNLIKGDYSGINMKEIIIITIILAIVLIISAFFSIILSKFGTAI